MKNSLEKNNDILLSYNNFISGSLVSFVYSESRAEKMSAKVTFNVRNHSLQSDVWRNVEIKLGDVLDICMKVKKNEIHLISSGVRLFKFGELWCLDIEGKYVGDMPSSLAQVRKEGIFYVTGRSIMITEEEEQN